MADALSGLLAGLNQGVQTGLDLYKTVEGEKRARREEEMRLDRMAVEDERWGMGWERQAKNDALSQANGERDFGMREKQFGIQEKQFGLQEETLKFNQQRALRTDAALERRHQQTMALSRARLDASSAANQTKARAAYGKARDGLVKELGGAFDGEKGTTNFAELANSHVNYRVALADKLGIQLSPDDLNNVRIIPAGDKFLLAKLDDKGQPTMWDPDGDGQPGYAIPTRVAALAVGGAKAAESADLTTTRTSLSGQVNRNAAAIEGQASSLGETLNTRNAAIEQAEFAREFEETGPRAEFLRQQKEAITGAEVSQFDGTRRYIDPSTGREAMVASGPASLSGVSKVRQADADQKVALAEADNSLASAQRSASMVQGRIDELPKQAKSLRDSWGTVEQQVRSLPYDQQQSALEGAAQTFDKSPALATRYPGKTLTEATDLSRKERGDFVDKVVGAVDLKTGTDFKGKPEALAGGKANLRSVLLSMPDEVWMSLSDHTGQMEGALQKAAQSAVDAGKPEAVPYVLYADKLGLDSKEAVTLMQDTALASIKDPKERFTYAVKALELVKAGKAPDAEVGLGMVMTGK